MIGLYRTFELRVAGTLLLATASGLAGSANAQDRFTVDASVAGGIARNPFLDTNTFNSSTVGSLTVDVQPMLAWDGPVSNLQLTGDANVTAYSSRYPVNDSYSANLNGERRISDTASLTGELGYSNTRLGSFNSISVPVLAPVDPNVPPTFVNPGQPSPDLRQRCRAGWDRLAPVLVSGARGHHRPAGSRQPDFGDGLGGRCAKQSFVRAQRV